MAPDLPSPGRGDARRRRSEAEEFQRREREPIGRRRGPVSYDRASHDRALYDEFDFRFDSSGLDDEFDWPPAPEVPSSPTTTTSFSQSSSTSSSIQHWVPKLFEQSPSNTPFKTIGPVYVRQLITRTFPNLGQGPHVLEEIYQTPAVDSQKTTRKSYSSKSDSRK